jgi:hypothetical protein
LLSPISTAIHNNPVFPVEVKKMAKKDRIGYAIQQEFLATVDPNTGEVPSGKLYDIYRELKRSSFAEVRDSDPIIWEERGPNNMAGRTRSILIDSADPTGNTVLVGSVSGGIWKSTNAKASTPTWVHTSGMMDNLAIGSLVQDPNNPSVLYAGTGEGYFNVDAVKGNGIWKSSNGGNTWSRLSSTANEAFYYTLRLEMNSLGYLFASTRKSGVMRSTNGGASWTKVLGENVYADSDKAVDLEIMSDGTLFASMGLFDTDGIYRSTNNGNSWVKLTEGLPDSDYHRIEMACSPQNNNIIYALFQDASNGNCSALYKSLNKGSSWTEMNLPLAFGMDNFARQQAWYNLAIAVAPDNYNRVIIGGIDLHLSNNGGSSWTQISQWAGLAGLQYVHADQHCIAFDNDGETVYFGHDGGISRCLDITDNNPGIETINTGYNVTQFYGAAIHPDASQPKILAGAQDNGTQLFSSPGMNATSEIAGGDGSFCHIDPANPNLQIATYVFNNYYVSTDGGLNFTLKSFNNYGRFANPSVYDNLSQKLYASNWAGSYFRWENPAQSGSATSSVAVSAFNSATVTALALSPNVNHRVYFGLNNGDVVKVENAHSGGSKTGTIVLNGSVGSISSIDIEEGNEDHLIVTYSNYGIESIKESHNAGNTWQDVEGNLPDFPVRWVVFDPENADKALIATELGVWRTDDLNGNNTLWYQENNGLDHVRVDMLVFRESDHYLVAATHGRGLFSSSSYVRPKINFDLTQLSVSEQSNSGDFGACNLDNQTIDIPVSISALPSNPVTVTFSIEPGSSASNGKDFVLLTNSLSFTPNSSLQKQLQIKILDEAIQEATEELTLEIVGDPNYLGDRQSVDVLIFDDDKSPSTGGSQEVQLGGGMSSTYDYPFGGYYEDERTQFLYKSEELLESGMTAGEIQKLALFITDKASDLPFHNFNIRLKMVDMQDIGPSGSGFVSGGDLVYSGSYSTIEGWNEFVFQEGFEWNGVSDLLVDICFNNSTWSDDDRIQSTITSFPSVKYTQADGASGCSFSISQEVSNQRPDIKFFVGANVNLANDLCSKTSSILQGEQAHFYHDGLLLASVKNLNGSDINCMELALDRAGTGIAYPVWMEGAGVTEKTFYIEADWEAPYEISLYYHPSELANWTDPLGLSIIKTNSAVSNSDGSAYQVVENEDLEVEVLDNGIIVYKAVFSSFSGFALTNLEPSTLAIDWLTFEVEKKEEVNRVNWSISEHLNGSEIHLQRSYEQIQDFKTIVTYSQGDRLIFTYDDVETRSGYSYYRLMILDKEGNVSFTPVRSVYREEWDGSWSIYPNPAHRQTKIFCNQAVKDKVRLQLFTPGGDLLMEKEELCLDSGIVLSLDRLLPGLYLLALENEDGKRRVKRLIVK